MRKIINQKIQKLKDQCGNIFFIFSIFSLFSLFQTRSSFSQTPGKQNHSIPFVEIYRDLQKHYNADDLKPYEIHFVKGYLTDLWKNIPGTSFLHETTQWAQKEGIDLKVIDINAEGTVEENSQIILEAIRNKHPDKKVILVGHSKGGVDILHALSKMSPEEVQEQLAGVLSLQAPYWGTPFADWVLKNSYLSSMMDFALRKWGGSDLSSLKDISTAERKKYHQENGQKLKELVEKTQLPLISLATYLEPSFPDKTMLFLRRWFIGEEPNDGLVTCEGAKTPFGDLVELEGADHAAPVMRGVQEVDRERFMKSLLSLVVKKINNKDDKFDELFQSWAARGHLTPGIPFQYPMVDLVKEGARLGMLLLILGSLPSGFTP